MEEGKQRGTLTENCLAIFSPFVFEEKMEYLTEGSRQERKKV